MIAGMLSFDLPFSTTQSLTSRAPSSRTEHARA
jgi:hypothetical protein